MSYNPNFIPSITLPLPTFSPELQGDVLHKVELREQIYVDYTNYTLAIHKQRRAPIFVALNISQTELISTQRSRWKLDTRIGYEYQLNNDYYQDNPWDRGHMARRANASWGKNLHEAQHASDDTMYYSNACLQHANLNQDEWLSLETWVKDLSLDTDGRITSFSGPIYGELNRSIQPNGRKLATIPAGFFKIVCFKNKHSHQLDVRAFLMYQDTEALRNKQGKYRFNNQNYQVTITEIEAVTGLRFDSEIYKQNVLYYNHSTEAHKVLAQVPECIEVSAPEDIVDKHTKRKIVKDDEIAVYISAAMVNPKGNDRKNEWISIVNYSGTPIDLSDWYLEDQKKNKLIIPTPNAKLRPGESLVLSPITPLILGNQGGIIQLYNQSAERIDRVKYFKAEVQEGLPILFLSRKQFSVVDDDMTCQAHNGR